MSFDGSVLIDGLKTRVRVHGDGPALLLIGGVWGQVDLWEELLPHLDGFTIVTFDPPGIGATQLPAMPYSLLRHAAFAVKVLDAVGIEQAHVLGVSLGGAVAQQVVHDFPDRVDRLVLVSTAYGIPVVVGRINVLLKFIRPRAYGDPKALERNADVIFGGRLREEPELVHRWHLRPPRNLRAYLWRLLGTTGWSSLRWLHTVERPTLVVHGDDDPIVPLLNGRVLAWRIPSSHLHVVEGGGHLLLLDSATDVLPVVTDFLSCPGQAPGTTITNQGNAS